MPSERSIVTGPCPRPILRFQVRGGLNNQKECLVNAAIVAHELGVTLALPHFDLIGSGNEKFEPSGASYVGPYGDRSRWGHFGHLFNASRFVHGLKGHVALLQRLRPVLGAGKPHSVRLPSDFAASCKIHANKKTCEAHEGDRSLLNELIASWRQAIATDCATPTGANATVFDAGQSLCWNAYKSRFAGVCTRQLPVCGNVLRALGWNRQIERLQSRVLHGLSRALSNASVTSSSPSAPPAWVAVHVRAFVCARNHREPTFGHVVEALRRQGITSGLLYLVSSVQLADVQRALPGFTVVAKSTFLGEGVRLQYPFEVLAAVDYGIAVAAPHYLGEPSMSSFDAFADEERQRRNRPEVAEIPSTCGSNASDLDVAHA